MDAHVKWAAHKPRAGQVVRYVDPDSKPPTDWTGKIVRVEGARAWVDYGNAGEEGSGLERFTWCFAAGLNRLHTWPTKTKPGSCSKCNAQPIMDGLIELDGDLLCQSCADAWCRGEAQERDAA